MGWNRICGKGLAWRFECLLVVIVARWNIGPTAMEALHTAI